MDIFKQTVKHKRIRKGVTRRGSINKGMTRKGAIAAGILIGATTFIFTPALTSQTLGQTPDVPGLSQQTPGLSDLEFSLPESIRELLTSDPAEVERATVWFDGRALFTVASLPISEQDNGSQGGATAAELRAEEIERALYRVGRSGVDPETLDVSVEFDSASNQPVIYANDQFLLTVTSLDAQLQGVSDLSVRAEEIAQIIEQALVNFELERQPQSLQRQGLLATGIVLITVVGGLGASRFQQRLKERRDHLSVPSPATVQMLANTSSVSGPVTANVVQQSLANLQKRNMVDIQRRLLQVGQLVIWGGGAFLVLGLFPYVRRLQPLIISVAPIPLKLLGLLLVTQVSIRLSAVVVDKFFYALQSNAVSAPEASQRLALRFSTFSRVTKGIVAVIVAAIGVITALSVVGIEVGPLLAGAGIIGLGISFASQSLIKDMINGFLILLEDQYGVGDVIVVGDVAGFVENMNLRITQLRNEEGRLITIPNSAIAIVQNLSKEWSRVDMTIEVAHTTNIDHALSVINRVAQELSRDRDWQHLILEPPKLLGIDKLDHVGALVRLWIKTQPLKQWDVAREYRRRLKLAFDNEGITIGVPQQSVSFTTALDLEGDVLTEVPQDGDRNLQAALEHSD